MSKHKIELTLPADLKFSSFVRCVSEEFFLHVGFVKEWAERLKLVVDELFMNANHYGSKKEGGRVYLFYDYDDEKVIFRIEDEGEGAKKISASELQKLITKNSDEMADISKTSGRGLALISSLWTDDMKVRDSEHGGIAVTFTKKITPSAPPAAPPIQSVDSKVATPVKPQGTKAEVEISGEIDSANLEEKIKPITEKLKVLPPGSTLIIDCKKLVYFNSTFIGHMAGWINELQAKQGHLILRNVNDQIREVLELVGLTKVLYIES